jgi:hypothetical protein
MTYLSRFSLFAVLLIGVIFIIGSGGSSGGGGTTSVWSSDSQIIIDNCGLAPDDVDLGNLTFTANGNSVTITDGEGDTYSGTLNGDVLTFSGSFVDEGAQINISGTITFDGDTFSGMLDYTIDEDGESCDGTLSITGTRISGTGPVVDDDGNGGDGSFSGNTDPAAIDDTNAEAIGTTSGEAAVNAIETTQANSANPFGIKMIMDADSLPDIVVLAARSAVASIESNNLPAGVVIDSSQLGPDFCGGSVNAPDSFGQNETLNGTLTFNDLCYNDTSSGQTITMSGQVIFVQNANEFSITYDDFTVTSNLGTSTLNAIMVCDADFLNCEWTSDFVGADGNIHQVSGAIAFDTGDGWQVNATLFHSEYGEIVISTTVPITFGQCGPFPDGGTIAYESENGSFGTVQFNGDCTYSGSWDDGAGNSGTYDGSFPT